MMQLRQVRTTHNIRAQLTLCKHSTNQLSLHAMSRMRLTCSVLSLMDTFTLNCIPTQQQRLAQLCRCSAVCNGFDFLIGNACYAGCLAKPAVHCAARVGIHLQGQRHPNSWNTIHKA